MKRIEAIITDARTETETRKYRFDPLYSGDALFIDGFDVPAYIDLATLKVDPAPKALLEHDIERVVGYLDNIVNDGRTITCDVIVGGTKDAEAVLDYDDNVAPFVPSIGVYRILDRDIEWLDVDETTEVNGREILGPAAIIHNGSLSEGSFVAIGGDGGARAARAKFKALGVVVMDEREEREKIDDAARDDERAAVDVEELVDAAVEEKAEELVGDVAEEAVDAVLNEDETREDIIDEVVDVAADKLDADAIADELETVKEEIVEELIDEGVDEERVAEAAAKKAVAKIRARLGRESRRRSALRALAKKSPKLAAKAIERGWTVDETKRKIKRAAARAAFPTVRSAAASAPRRQDVLAASLAMTLGMSPKRAQAAFKFDERVVDAATSKEYRGATLRTIVAAANNSHKAGSFGVNTNMLDAWNDCRQYCRAVKASAGFSTVNALDVFSSVLQAFLEPTEETAERVWPNVARVNTLADFNSVPSYLPTLQGRLREISETGAISNITFTTERFENATRANGVNFTIPEMVIINDQIDVFAELLRQFETLADDCVEHDVAEMFWKVIDGDAKDGDGNALVSAARGNYIASSSLDEAGLGAALVALNSFATKNGVPLSADGSVLLTGSKLGPTALKLWAQEYVDFANGTATPNIYRGRFQPLVWTYLDKAHARAKKDDGSTDSLLQGEKTWALLRNPSTRPVVCVNKLIGYESPQIRQFDYDPAVWGVTYQLIYPYSVSAQYADGIIVSTNS